MTPLDDPPRHRRALPAKSDETDAHQPASTSASVPSQAITHSSTNGQHVLVVGIRRQTDAEIVPAACHLVDDDAGRGREQRGDVRDGLRRGIPHAFVFGKR